MQTDLMGTLFASFGLLLLTLFIGAIVRSLLSMRKLRRIAAANQAERLALARICTVCGYDVRAARNEGASGLCPECGAKLLDVHL